jgi:integrase
VIVLIPHYTGARISEVVRLDVDDVRPLARKAELRVYGERGKVLTVQFHFKLRTELDLGLEERCNRPGETSVKDAAGSPAGPHPPRSR